MNREDVHRLCASGMPVALKSVNTASALFEVTDACDKADAVNIKREDGKGFRFSFSSFTTIFRPAPICDICHRSHGGHGGCCAACTAKTAASWEGDRPPEMAPAGKCLVPCIRCGQLHAGLSEVCAGCDGKPLLESVIASGQAEAALHASRNTVLGTDRKSLEALAKGELATEYPVLSREEVDELCVSQTPVMRRGFGFNGALYLVAAVNWVKDLVYIRDADAREASWPFDEFAKEFEPAPLCTRCTKYHPDRGPVCAPCNGETAQVDKEPIKKVVSSTVDKFREYPSSIGEELEEAKAKDPHAEAIIESRAQKPPPLTGRFLETKDCTHAWHSALPGARGTRCPWCTQPDADPELLVMPRCGQQWRHKPSGLSHLIIWITDEPMRGPRGVQTFVLKAHGLPVKKVDARDLMESSDWSYLRGPTEPETGDERRRREIERYIELCPEGVSSSVWARVVRGLADDAVPRHCRDEPAEWLHCFKDAIELFLRVSKQRGSHRR